MQTTQTDPRKDPSQNPRDPAVNPGQDDPAQTPRDPSIDPSKKLPTQEPNKEFDQNGLLLMY
jgi:hypothetical protein